MENIMSEVDVMLEGERDQIIDTWKSIKNVDDLESAYRLTMGHLKEQYATNMRQLALARFYDNLFKEAAANGTEIPVSNNASNLIAQLEESRKIITDTMDKLDSLHTSLLRSIRLG